MACLYQRTKNGKAFGSFYIQDRVGKRIVRHCLKTTSKQVAKEKLRQYESAKLHGVDSPLPTRTPIGEVVQAYVEHIRTVKTAKSAQTDVYYLREVFGDCCEAVKVNSRKRSEKARKRPLKENLDRRCRPAAIEAGRFEAIGTVDIQRFIDSHVRSRGLAPKTANRYREIICRLFNWAMKQKLVRMPGGENPAKAVERHKERPAEIRFLTLPQIDEQLHGLRFVPKLQTMVAMLIYAGLRREELLWLQRDDLDLTRTAHSHGIIRVRAKTVDGRFWQPKTKKNRAVPISATLRGYLDRYSPEKNAENWLFPSPWGTQWDVDNFSRGLRGRNKDLGLRWSCLDFRHTFGSQLAQKGVSLYKIAELMGNSPEIARRHYAALCTEVLGAEVEFGQPRDLGSASAPLRTALEHLEISQW